jgi:predicted MPP superfamily phosphohydrolase
VALTGDLIHDTAGLEIALGLIRQLRPRLGAFSVPGNHDYCEYSMWGVFDHAGSASPAATAGKLLDFTRKVLNNELVRMPIAFNDMTAMEAALRRAGVEPLVNRARAVPGLDGALWMRG